MNRGITIARRGEAYEVLVTPEVPFVEQRRNFRNLRAHLTDVDEIELWSSGRGRVKRYRTKPKVVAVEAPAAVKSDEVSVPATDSSVEVPTSDSSTASAPKKARKSRAAKPAKKP